MVNLASSADANKTFTQALQLPDSDTWVETCAAEVASLQEHTVHEVQHSSFGGQISAPISSNCKEKMGREYL